MQAKAWRFGLHATRRALLRLDTPWRHLVVAAVVGALGALAVAAFRQALFALEAVLVGAGGGHLVAAASALPAEARVLAPALGGMAAGLLLWLAERGRDLPAEAQVSQHRGDYIEAVVIGTGRLDLRAGLLKVAASMLVVSTGGAVGREGAMVLLAAMLASMLGRALGRATDLRLVVSCGAAAGLAAAYHAPLAGAVFVAEILVGSLALAQLGPVVVAAVMAFGVSVWLGERSVPFPVAALTPPGPAQVVWLLVLS
ncbi:MAG: chloride channel protein, partial [Pseudomonadota bacterium]